VCDRSAEDAYSSAAPDPTSGVSRGPCRPNFYCGLFPVPSVGTDIDYGFFPVTWLDSVNLTEDCSVHLIWTE
jgi:hypothetical protein